MNRVNNCLDVKKLTFQKRKECVKGRKELYEVVKNCGQFCFFHPGGWELTYLLDRTVACVMYSL